MNLDTKHAYGKVANGLVAKPSIQGSGYDAYAT